jgi:cellulose synthase/poly-beta-1,6-N-acetylglucosamine synthase-like glycosyltransferase
MYHYYYYIRFLNYVFKKIFNMFWIDSILFFIFALNALYVFIFAFASLFPTKIKQVETTEHKKIAVLIPAYKEDRVIIECVQSLLAQDYPDKLFTIAVISDQMDEKTNQQLSELPICLIVATFESSTKSKALNLAMNRLDEHDIAIILDADNTVNPNFLNDINQYFAHPDARIVQTHRTAKNLNTNLAYLDAASEEINNSIFRQGHVNLGFSASFIGSGMAFEYNLFKNEMHQIDAIGGFDRNLMLALLKREMQVGYLPETYVFDEKVQSTKTFSKQRKRWLSAQFHYVGVYLKTFPVALIRGNWDFCDIYIQQLLLPRVILIGFTFLIALAATFIDEVSALKWWIVFVAVAFALLLSIPSRLMTSKLMIALIALPEAFFSMFLNFFRLKGANQNFIHTPHGTI